MIENAFPFNKFIDNKFKLVESINFKDQLSNDKSGIDWFEAYGSTSSHEIIS